MKLVFPIAAIIVTLIAGYFTLSQKEKFTTVQTARLEAITKNKSVSKAADKAFAKIKELEGVMETSKDNLAEVTQSVLALRSAQAPPKRELSKLNAQLTTQTTEIEELEKKFAQVETIVKDLDVDGVSLDNLQEKVDEIEEMVEAKTTKAGELKTLLEGANKALSQREDELKRLAARKMDRSKRIAQGGVRARISAVNSDWGFVVIGAGKNAGFNPQSSLVVVRNGSLIGRLTPSSVELNQTIADIDIDSVSSGIRLQPGDVVMTSNHR